MQRDLAVADPSFLIDLRIDQTVSGEKNLTREQRNPELYIKLLFCKNALTSFLCVLNVQIYPFSSIRESKSWSSPAVVVFILMTGHKVYWTKYSNLKMTCHPLFQTTSTCQIKNWRLYICIFFLFWWNVSTIFLLQLTAFHACNGLALNPTQGGIMKQLQQTQDIFYLWKITAIVPLIYPKGEANSFLNIDIVVAIVFVCCFFALL